MHVPDFTGCSYRDAIALGENVGVLVALAPDNEPERSTVGRPLGSVVAQEPAPGAPTEHHASVYIWMNTGRGPGGVREPRRPSPRSDAASHQGRPAS
jgi:beta-lactam-binding protein with PASTA domain